LGGRKGKGVKGRGKDKVDRRFDAKRPNLCALEGPVFVRKVKGKGKYCGK